MRGARLRPHVVALDYTPPMAWAPLLAFLGARAIPGVEHADADSYRRTIDVGGGSGHLEVRHRPARRVLDLTAWVPDAGVLPGVVEGVRRLFDLSADPGVIASHFRGDPILGPRVRRVPGLRVPGAWDPFELGIRALLGQQVTVKGASTLAGRLVSHCGHVLREGRDGLTHRFPTAEGVAAADLSALGVPAARRQALQGFAQAVARGEVAWNRPDVDAALSRLPGFGDWTVQYILMRGCHDPDAFPASDLWLMRAVGTTRAADVTACAERWRPFRAYAAMYLWQSGPGG